MPSRAGEAPAQNLKDIEDGGTAIARKCFNCGHKQKKLVSMIGGAKTKNYIGICENKKCFRYCDVEKLESWSVE